MNRGRGGQESGPHHSRAITTALFTVLLIYAVIAVTVLLAIGPEQLAAATAPLFLTPDRVHHVVVALTQGELSEDPGDLIATRLLHTADGLTGNAVLFGSIYLLAHGIVKIALVVALLLNKIWAYPWMIAVLLLFIAYQLYRIALNPTAGLIALTVFDVVIVALTWREYGRQRQRRQTAPTETPRGDV